MLFYLPFHLIVISYISSRYMHTEPETPLFTTPFITLSPVLLEVHYYIKFIRTQWLKQCSYRRSAESERLQPAQSEQQNRGTWHEVQTSNQSSYQCFYCLGLNHKQARFHLHHRWLCHYRTTEFCDDDSLAETWPGLQHPCKGSITHRLF